MGQHAEDEIHREMFGCYPWEEIPVYGHKHGRQSKSKMNTGRAEYRGIRMYIQRSGVKDRETIRFVMVRYAKEILGWDNEKANSTANDPMAFEIGKDFNSFSTWWGNIKGEYIKNKESKNVLNRYPII